MQVLKRMAHATCQVNPSTEEPQRDPVSCNGEWKNNQIWNMRESHPRWQLIYLSLWFPLLVTDPQSEHPPTPGSLWHCKGCSSLTSVPAQQINGLVPPHNYRFSHSVTLMSILWFWRQYCRSLNISTEGPEHCCTIHTLTNWRIIL